MTTVNITANKPLSPYTTLEIGGPARFFAEVKSEPEIEEVISWAAKRNLPSFVLGGGSNLLVADAGFEGLVVHIALKGVEVGEAGLGERIYQVAAGEDWEQCVQRTLEDSCAGLECLAGIPGTVGGTPVQNVGAYGQEVSSVINRVRAFDLREKKFAEFGAEECGFSYRRSRFNTTDRGRFVVTRVDYRLRFQGAPTLKYAELQRAFPSDATPSLKEVAATVRQIRQSKGMLLVGGDPDCKSAGSFFKNPIVSEECAARVESTAGSKPPRFPGGPGREEQVKLPAAWLIEQAGFSKGYAAGRVGISRKHTLALVNLGGATAAELLALAGQIKQEVASRFAIELEMEPVMLGF